MAAYSWDQFALLPAAGLGGAVAGMPCGFAIHRDRLHCAPPSMRQSLIASMMQTAVLLAVAIGVGLLLWMGIHFIAPGFAGIDEAPPSPEAAASQQDPDWETDRRAGDTSHAIGAVV